MAHHSARSATAARPEDRPAAGRDADPAALSDDDIALLADLGGPTPLADDEATGARIARLIAQGFLRSDSEGARESVKGLQLTRKAEDFLVARGAGLNEA